LETTESSIGRGNREAVAAVQCRSWGGRPGKLGGGENQAGQAVVSASSCVSAFFHNRHLYLSTFLCLPSYSNCAGKEKKCVWNNKITKAKDLHGAGETQKAVALILMP